MYGYTKDPIEKKELIKTGNAKIRIFFGAFLYFGPVKIDLINLNGASISLNGKVRSLKTNLKNFE